MKKSTYAPAAVVLILTACNGSSQSSRGDAEQKALLQSATKAFHEALLANDAETFMSFVSDDVALMPPGQPAIRGKKALRTWYQEFLSQFHTASVSVDHQEVWLDGALAVETGTYEWVMVPTSGGAQIVDRGNYMQVWRREPDGRWHFIRELYNNPEPPASSH